MLSVTVHPELVAATAVNKKQVRLRGRKVVCEESNQESKQNKAQESWSQESLSVSADTQSALLSR